MNIVDFHKELLEEVKDEAFVDGEGSTAAFTNRVATYLIDSQVLSGFSPAFYQGKGKKQRNIHVDGYYLDDFDVTLNLIISDYSGNENRETITRTIATTEFDKLKHFIEEVYENNLLEKVEESTTAYDLIDTMQINRDRIRKFRLFLWTSII